MKNPILSLTKEFIKVVIIVAVAVPMVSLFAAWTEPTMSPPDGNVPAPVNVGNIFQKKAGDFAVGGGFGVDGGAAFNVQYLGIDNLKMTLIDPNTGNVGIGTINPQAKLDVVGKIKVSDDVSAPSAGMIRWTGSDFEGYTGAGWKSLTAASGMACSPPRQQVLIDGVSVCLKEGTEITASCSDGAPKGSSSIRANGSARFQGGNFQTRFWGKRHQSSCDSGWVDGRYATCSRTGDNYGNARITPTGLNIYGIGGSAVRCSESEPWP